MVGDLDADVIAGYGRHLALAGARGGRPAAPSGNWPAISRRATYKRTHTPSGPTGPRVASRPVFPVSWRGSSIDTRVLCPEALEHLAAWHADGVEATCCCATGRRCACRSRRRRTSMDGSPRHRWPGRRRRRRHRAAGIALRCGSDDHELRDVRELGEAADRDTPTNALLGRIDERDHFASCSDVSGRSDTDGPEPKVPLVVAPDGHHRLLVDPMRALLPARERICGQRPQQLDLAREQFADRLPTAVDRAPQILHTPRAAPCTAGRARRKRSWSACSPLAVDAHPPTRA